MSTSAAIEALPAIGAILGSVCPHCSAELPAEADPTPIVWLTIGFVGQGVFFGRFLIQWLASERAGRSVIPVAFWYFSLVGGLITLSYAIYRLDPVFIVGQSTGTLIYARNLWFIHGKGRGPRSPGPDRAPAESPSPPPPHPAPPPPG